jgi:hypothetical protein
VVAEVAAVVVFAVVVFVAEASVAEASVEAALVVAEALVVASDSTAATDRIAIIAIPGVARTTTKRGGQCGGKPLGIEAISQEPTTQRPGNAPSE